MCVDTLHKGENDDDDDNNNNNNNNILHSNKKAALQLVLLGSNKYINKQMYS
jgi:hypothetical protein